MLALGTLATFAFYQWTQACTSGLMLFLSASIFIFALLMLAGASFLILFISKKPGGLEQLFSKDHSYARRWGSMYNTLNKGQLYFAVALWVTVLIRSAITAFGQSNGLAQVIAMIILEFVVCVSESTSPMSLSPVLTSSRYLPLPAILQPRVQQSQLPHPRYQAGFERGAIGLRRHIQH